jgi:hypothetical protein
MAYDVTELNVSTGKTITREYTQAEKDAIEASKPSTDEKWVRIRSRRDALLRNCDWWASSDLTMSDAQTAYRKALRDLPASKSNPDEIVFPSKP